jgi:ribonuclease E
MVALTLAVCFAWIALPAWAAAADGADITRRDWTAYKQRHPDLRAADNALNATYGAIMNRLSSEAGKQLVREQRQWLRDRNAKAFADQAKGSPDSFVVLTDMTRERETALRGKYLKAETRQPAPAARPAAETVKQAPVTPAVEAAQPAPVTPAAQPAPVTPAVEAAPVTPVAQAAPATPAAETAEPAAVQPAAPAASADKGGEPAPVRTLTVPARGKSDRIPALGSYPVHTGKQPRKKTDASHVSPDEQKSGPPVPALQKYHPLVGKR